MSWFKSDREWQPIATVPEDKVVELACDTTDCGWCFFYGWTKHEKNESGDSIFYSAAPTHESMPVIHVPPSHWRNKPRPPKEEVI
jgi:hypothetical protein